MLFRSWLSRLRQSGIPGRRSRCRSSRSRRSQRWNSRRALGAYFEVLEARILLTGEFSIIGPVSITEDSNDGDGNSASYTISYSGTLAAGETASVDVSHLLGESESDDYTTSMVAAIQVAAAEMTNVSFDGTTLVFVDGGTPSTSIGIQSFAGSAVTGVGGDSPWINPANAVGDTPTDFTSIQLDRRDVGDPLRLTDFGFSIPTGAMIEGIEVALLTTGSDEPDSGNAVVITKDGSAAAGTAATFSGGWSNGSLTIGSPAELWGTTWTAAEINSADFGLIVEIESGSDDDEFRLYTAQIEVTYGVANILDQTLQVVDLSDLDGDLPLAVDSSTQVLSRTQDWEHSSFGNPSWPSGGADDAFGYPTVVKNVHGLNPDGKYYLYYAHHDPMSGIGGAVADDITGPFTKAAVEHEVLGTTWTDSQVVVNPNYRPASLGGPDPDGVAHFSSPSVVWNEDEQLWFMYFHYYNHYWGGAGGEAWNLNNPGLGQQMTALATTPDLSSHDWTIWTDPAWAEVSVWDIVPVLPTTDATWMESQSSYHAIQRLPDGQWLAFLRGTPSSGGPTVGFATSNDGRNWNYFSENPVIASGKPWTVDASEYRPKFIGYLGENESGEDEYLVAWSEHSDPNIIYGKTTDFKTFERDPRGYASWGVGEDGIVSAWREEDRLYLFAGEFVHEMLLPVSTTTSIEFTMVIADDGLVEGDEVFSLSLANAQTTSPEGAILGTPLQSTTIIDNEPANAAEFLFMSGYHDEADPYFSQNVLPYFNVIGGTTTNAAFVESVRSQGKIFSHHVFNNPAATTVQELVDTWRVPFDNTLGGALPGGFDAVHIDEIHPTPNGSAESLRVIAALEQLRALYPNKQIYTWSQWQLADGGPNTLFGNPADSFSDVLNAINDVADMNMLEHYIREGNNQTHLFNTFADNLESFVPGVLDKTVFGLYTSQGGFAADDSTDVGYWGFLDAQLHAIRNDPEMSTMPGASFWVHYRSEPLTSEFAGRLVDHYFTQGNSGYFGDGNFVQLVSNPQFEVDTNGWVLTPAFEDSLSRFQYSSEGVLDYHDAFGLALHGGSGLKMERGVQSNQADYSISVDPNLTYTVSAFVLAGSGSSDQAAVEIIDSTGSLIAGKKVIDAAPVVGTGDWKRIMFHFDLAADQNEIRIRLTDQSSAPGTILYWDFVELEEAFVTPFIDISAGLPGVSSGSVAWGDYDNDGDLDILLTGSDEDSNKVSLVYQNQGGGAFVDIAAGLTGVVVGAVDWGDYDNDGDLDILLTGSDSGLIPISRVYENQGGGAFVDIAAGLTDVEFGSASWGDYDNDGDLDILLTGTDISYNYITRVYENQGGGTFSDASAGLTGAVYSLAEWGDYDNDGDLDILLAGYEKSSGVSVIAQVYENRGRGRFSDITDISGDLTEINVDAAAWGDYDNDGDLDILITGRDEVDQVLVTRVYENQGSGTFVDISAGLTGVRASTVQWGDYDNDGDLDILITGLDGSLNYASTLYENQGSGTFADISAGLPNISIQSTAWGDYDNDGDLDILLTGRDDFDLTSFTQIWQNNSLTANTAPAAPAGLSATQTGPTSAALTWTAPADAQTPGAGLSYNLRVGTTPGGSDVVGPMAFDATSGLRKIAQRGSVQDTSWTIDGLVPGQTYYWSVQAIDTSLAGSPFAPEQSFETLLSFPLFTDISAGLPAVVIGSVAWGDYDNDGDLDVLLAGRDDSYNYISRVYENQGSGTFADVSAGLTGIGRGSVAWGDYDNDGDLDIALTGRSNADAPLSRVYENQGGGTFVDISAGLIDVEHSSVAWGDYDNDGDLDILLTGDDDILVGEDSTFISRVYENQGGGTFADISAGLAGVRQSSVAWGDYDNDGDLDILLTGRDNSFNAISLVYENQGGGTFTDISAGLIGVRQSSAAWGDYDNDGDLDILIIGRDNSDNYLSQVYENQGGGTFADISAGLTGARNGSADWGDFDNDGDLDILITGDSTSNDRIALVYENQGNAAFTDISAGLTGVQGSSAAWGDYDDDGDLDVLLTGSDSSNDYVSQIWQNNSVTGNAVPAAPTGLSATADGLSVTFSWTAPADTETPSAGLSYNLRVGTTPGGSDVVAPMAFNPNNGLRKVAQPGLIQGTSWTIEGLLPGQLYYWSVQAIDTTLAGSAFATEQSFNPQFSDIVAGLPDIRDSVAWGDYDNDGDLDLLIAGYEDILNIRVSRVYENQGDGSFVDISAGLPGIANGQLAWGDYDNDGDLDILLTGRDNTYNHISRVYENHGGGTFADTSAGLIGVAIGSAAWGDYDNDGDLDILITGIDNSSAPISQVYENQGGGTFAEVSAGLTGVSFGSAGWGDYDNDGDLDILLTGRDSSLNPVSQVYKNQGGGTFVEVSTGLSGVWQSSAVWGDYGGDGDLDILITGRDQFGIAIARIYENRGADTFVDASANLPGVMSGSAEWGDFDNDGDLDVVVVGDNVADIDYVARVYENQGGSAFVDVSAGLPGVSNASAAWGDYDDDGDLDLVIIGDTTDGPIAQIWKNNVLTANSAPAAPTGLSSTQTGPSSVTFAWTEPTDAETSEAGLTYNLRVGTTPGGSDIVGPMALHATTGHRKIAQPGSIQDTSWTLKGLPSGQTYYWSVQAIDSSMAGSPFAAEQSVTVSSSAIAFSDITAGLSGVRRGSVAWGDFDNDRDLDLLITGRDSNGVPVSQVYENQGAGTFVDIAAGLPGVDDGSVAWGDYDNDGDLDILITGYNVANTPISQVYENQGGGTFASIFAGLTGVRNSAAAWGDYDNDGDLDILIAGYDPSNTPVSQVYENQGGGTFADISAGLTGVRNSAVAWGDFDNDGDLDILLTGRDISLTPISQVYENQGGGTFTDISAGLIALRSGSVAWGDYDNDGDLDILIAGEDVSFNYYSRVYENQGGGTFTDISAALIGVAFSSTKWGDYDTDGDLDILLAGYRGEDDYVARVYENQGGGTFADISAGLPGVDSGSAAWGDYDNDGDLDILITGENITGDAISQIWENNGPSTNTIPLPPTGLSATLTGPTTGTLSWVASSDTQTPDQGLSYNLRVGTTPGGSDVVGPMAFDATDGLRKVAQPGLIQGTTWTIEGLVPGQAYYWSVQAVDSSLAGSAFAAEQSLPSAFYEISAGLIGVDLSAVAWGDYDNDGDLDILITGRDDSLGVVAQVYENQGGGTFADIFANLPGVERGAVAWGDYDNDGDLDILLAGRDSADNDIARVYENQGGGTFVDISAGLTGVGVSSAAWGDYDNDGDLDILLAGYGASIDDDAQVYENQGGGTFVDISAGLPGLAYGSAVWGDYDNDGDLDILLTGDGPLGVISQVYENQGGGTFANISAGLIGLYRSSAAWGDYDNDGDLDILLTGSDRVPDADGNFTMISRVYQNQGDGTFTDILAGLTGVRAGSANWGDYDNDGDLDILLTGSHAIRDYVSKVYENRGGGRFTDISADFIGLAFSSAAWGDYDADGDLDILLSGFDRSRDPTSQVWQNNVLPANTPPAAPGELAVASGGPSLVTFSWTAPSDTETPVAGLTYNLRVGTTPGGSEVIGPMALSSPDGLRTIAQTGLIRGTSWTIEGLLPGGTYYWSVQAVDSSLAGSPFAEPSQFILDADGEPLDDSHLALAAGIWAFDLGIVNTPAFMQADLATAAHMVSADHPDVRGLAPRFTWRNLQTGSDTYNWAALDKLFQIAEAYDKSIALRIIGGVNVQTSPSFIWDDVDTYIETFNPIWGTTIRIPHLGDPSFDNQWHSFIQAVGARYQDNALLQRVHISSGLDQEMYYVRGLTDTELADLMPAGIDAGIIDLKTSWSNTVDVYKAAFTRTDTSLLPVAFAIDLSDPVIGVDGIDGYDVVEEIVFDASDALGHLLYLQQDGLNDTNLTADEILSLPGDSIRKLMLTLSDKHALGFETLVPPELNPPPEALMGDLRDTIDVGLTFPITYMEIYTVNLNDSANDQDIDFLNVALLDDHFAQFDVRLVDVPTALDAKGEVSVLPDNQEWIHEWQSFYVEIYVSTPLNSGVGITDAYVELEYNGLYFTATAIEHGPAFPDFATGSIDDAAGKVGQLGGATADLVLDVGDDNPALLARVYFESVGTDAVDIDWIDEQVGPHSLGLGLNVLDATFSDDETAPLLEDDYTVNPLPQTPVYAIPLDVDDNAAISLSDIAFLADAFGQTVSEATSPYAWVSDVDLSGVVSLTDVLYFADNFGRVRGGEEPVALPPTFPGSLSLLASVVAPPALKVAALSTNESETQVVEVDSSASAGIGPPSNSNAIAETSESTAGFVLLPADSNASESDDGGFDNLSANSTFVPIVEKKSAAATAPDDSQDSDDDLADDEERLSSTTNEPVEYEPLDAVFGEFKELTSDELLFGGLS